MTPPKTAAIILAFVGPWGIGHFHLGRRARGIGWLGAATLAAFASGVLVRTLGPAMGWTFAVTFPVVVMFVVWLAAMIDLFRLDAGVVETPLWQTALFVVAGLVAPALASVVMRGFVLESFVVPTTSMVPTLLAGDHLFADKLDTRAAYGDVIVFESPEHPEQMLVKRVVARPGDALEVRHGRPWINGWEVPSCPLGTVTLGDLAGELEVEFLGDASYLVFYDASAPVAAHAGPLYAASDAVLVLGDDRNDSADSRAWHQGRDGNVRTDAIRGRAMFVWLRSSAADDVHFGVDLERIALPATLASVRRELDRCLATRPSANPPAPLSPR